MSTAGGNYRPSPYAPPPGAGTDKPPFASRPPPPLPPPAAPPADESRHPPSSDLRPAASADERVQPSDSDDLGGQGHGGHVGVPVHPADRWGRTVAVSGNGVLPRGGPTGSGGAAAGRDAAAPPPGGFAPSRSGAFAPYYKPAAFRVPPHCVPARHGRHPGMPMGPPPSYPYRVGRHPGPPPPRHHAAMPAPGGHGSDAHRDLRTVPTSDSMEGLVRAAEHVMEQELRERASSGEDDGGPAAADDARAARRPPRLPALSTGALPPANGKRPIGAVNVDDDTPKHFNTASHLKRARVAEGGRTGHYDPSHRGAAAGGGRPEEAPEEAREDGHHRPRGDSDDSALRQANSYGIDPSWTAHAPPSSSMGGTGTGAEFPYYEPANYLGSGSLSFEMPPHALSALRSFPDLNDDAARPGADHDKSSAATLSPRPDEKGAEEAETPPLPHQGSMPIKKRIAGMMMSPGRGRAEATGERAAARSPLGKDGAGTAGTAAAEDGAPDEGRGDDAGGRDPRPEDDGRAGPPQQQQGHDAVPYGRSLSMASWGLGDLGMSYSYEQHGGSGPTHGAHPGGRDGPPPPPPHGYGPPGGGYYDHHRPAYDDYAARGETRGWPGYPPEYHGGDPAPHPSYSYGHGPPPPHYHGGHVGRGMADPHHGPPAPRAYRHHPPPPPGGPYGLPRHDSPSDLSANRSFDDSLISRRSFRSLEDAEAGEHGQGGEMGRSFSWDRTGGDEKRRRLTEGQRYHAQQPPRSSAPHRAYHPPGPYHQPQSHHLHQHQSGYYGQHPQDYHRGHPPQGPPPPGGGGGYHDYGRHPQPPYPHQQHGYHPQHDQPQAHPSMPPEQHQPPAAEGKKTKKKKKDDSKGKRKKSAKKGPSKKKKSDSDKGGKKGEKEKKLSHKNVNAPTDVRIGPALDSAPQQDALRRLARRNEVRTIPDPSASDGRRILLLSMPDDHQCLSETLCIVRNNVEVFTADGDDVRAPAPGRKRPIQVGQVGLRCVYCRGVPGRDRVKRATCFPSSVKRIYRAMIDMKLDHFANCPHVPEGLKARLRELQSGATKRSTGMTVQYFVRSALRVGMHDVLEGGQEGVALDADRAGTSGPEAGARGKARRKPPAAPPALPPAPGREAGADDAATAAGDGGDGAPAGGEGGARDGPEKATGSAVVAGPCHIEEKMDGVRVFTGQVPLALPEDPSFLSPLRVFLRRHVAAFSATADDVAVRLAHNAQSTVRIGQVGFACVHCLGTSPGDRSNRAVCFPATLERLYQSVADVQRFHLQECAAMPPDAKAEMTRLQADSAKGSRGLSTRQYWIDAARVLGMRNGPAGIYFGREPGVPKGCTVAGDGAGIPLLSASPTSGIERLDVIEQRKRNRGDEALDVSLVNPEDRPDIAEFLYVVMDQLRPCKFTDADRNKRRSKNLGTIGVECKHCAHVITGRKFFWSSISAAESNFVSVHQHMMKCQHIPEHLRDEIGRLKELRREQTAALPSGSQKAFFTKVWHRLHGEDAPAFFPTEDAGRELAVPVLSSSSPPTCGAPPSGDHAPRAPPNPLPPPGAVPPLPAGRSHDSSDDRALLMQPSTLSLMPSVDDSSALNDADGHFTIGDLQVRNNSSLRSDDGDALSRASGAEDDDAIRAAESKSSAATTMTNVAEELSAVRVHCSRDDDEDDLRKEDGGRMVGV